MSAYKPIAALLAVACAALAPMARADDDATALRAELESLKSDYDARVAALEARIAALESAPPAAAATRRWKPFRAVDPGEQRLRVQSRDLARARPATTPTPSREPEDWRHRRLHAERRRDRTRRAQLQPRRIRDDARGQRRSVLHGAAHRRHHGRGRDRGGGGLLPHAGAARRDSRRRAGVSSPASATSTRCTRTPGTSRTSRSSIRPSSATSARRTACSSSGSRRPTCSSSSAPRPAMATRSRARGSRGTA